MKLACVLIAAIFREYLVFLVLLGHMAKMACLVNSLAVPNRIVRKANDFAFSMRIMYGHVCSMQSLN